ncbi:MAG: outer membrane protein transport protein [Myxococcaceae bacterium]|nr:outer membrane protein transport protein [Myxococcaceae bacterium]
MRAAAVALALVGRLALANSHDTFGDGPRAAAMAGAMVAEANDYTATFYNPALLTRAETANFGLGFSWYRLQGDVTSKDPSRQLDCAYCSSPDAVAFQLGFVFPLGGKLKNHVSLGVGLLVPATRLVRLLAPDPEQPYWITYNSNPERLLLHAGVGIKITEWFSLGVGIQAFADLLGDGAQVQVDLFSKQVTKRSVDSSLVTRASPVFSVAITPIKQLRFGVTFRWERFLEYSIPASVDLKGVGTLGFNINGITHYTPHELEFGAAWDPIPQLTIAVSGTWMNWSRAPSPYMGLTVDLSGDTLKALGLDGALDVSSPSQPPGFADTVSGRLGIEYRISDRFAARGGAFFRPTMVPKQDAPGTNILDGPTVGLTAGLGFNFSDPLEIFSRPVTIDLATQGQFVLARETNKEATDVTPSYSYSGRAYGLTIAVRYDF